MIKMQYYISLGITILSILLVGCNNPKKVMVNDSINKAESIKIIYEDLFTLTMSRVSCDEMEKTFQKVIKSKHIVNQSDVRLITELIDKTKNNNNRTVNLDVRYKMIINYLYKANDTICGNGSVIQINQVNYLISKEFSDLLIDLTDSEI